MKYAFMEQHSKEFKIEKMAHVLKVSRQGYYKHLNSQPSKREQENQRLIKKLREIHKGKKNVYGSPGMYEELNPSS